MKRIQRGGPTSKQHQQLSLDQEKADPNIGTCHGRRSGADKDRIAAPLGPIQRPEFKSKDTGQMGHLWCPLANDARHTGRLF